MCYRMTQGPDFLQATCHLMKGTLSVNPVEMDLAARTWFEGIKQPSSTSYMWHWLNMPCCRGHGVHKSQVRHQCISPIQTPCRPTPKEAGYMRSSPTFTSSCLGKASPVAAAQAAAYRPPTCCQTHSRRYGKACRRMTPARLSPAS